MRALRNRLVHAYFGTDLDIVWQTVTGDLPGIRPRLAALLQALPDDGP